ncbi:hypothetical protein [Actinoplanes sp. HUAS TT8]|uniref:hypothetical protein n=1 Tax=Actinoplanes sp. HUAS TT8 TaxID=3447453 RepID=UPI003F528650
MLVSVLLDQAIGVHYGFLDLRSAQADDGQPGDEDAPWRGQINGLLGAADPEVLRIRTRLHTANVPVRVELHTDAPEPGDEWTEIVEAGFATWVDDLWLSGFDQSAGPLDLPPGYYRVRYSSRGDGETEEWLLLQFWPADDDRVVRQTTGDAAYWHRTGVVAALTAEEITEAVEELREVRESWVDPEDPIFDREPLRGTDGVLTPLRDLPERVHLIAEVDNQVATGLAAADPPVLRAITRWAADLVLTAAGIREMPEVAEAMAALYRGEPLPPGTRERIEARLPPMPTMPAEVTGAFLADHRETLARHHAVLVLQVAADPGTDPLDAACSMLWLAGGAVGGGAGWIMPVLRKVFPALVPA